MEMTTTRSVYVCLQRRKDPIFVCPLRIVRLLTSAGSSVPCLVCSLLACVSWERQRSLLPWRLVPARWINYMSLTRGIGMKLPLKTGRRFQLTPRPLIVWGNGNSSFFYADDATLQAETRDCCHIILTNIVVWQQRSSAEVELNNFEPNHEVLLAAVPSRTTRGRLQMF